MAKGTQSDKVLRDKALKIASDPKYDGYQRGLASMVQWFTSILIKHLVEVISLMNQIINWQMSFTNQVFENSKKKFIYLLEAIFGVLI